MGKQFIEHWEFKPLIMKAISSYIDKYELKFSNNNNPNGIELKNDKIYISISDRYGDFSVGIGNGKSYLTINEIIFKKYPNYIELIKIDEKNIVFKLTIKDFELYNEYFIYLLKTSFDFIETNYPLIFKGEF